MLLTDCAALLSLACRSAHRIRRRFCMCWLRWNKRELLLLLVLDLAGSEQVWALPRAIRALKYRTNLVDLSRRCVRWSSFLAQPAVVADR